MPLDAIPEVADIRKPATHLHNSFPSTWPPETADAFCAVCQCRKSGKPYPMEVVLDLGEQPLANALLTSPDQECHRFPLRLAECTNCRHVQLAQTVRPDLMFDEYVYRTGVSATMRRHFEGLASQLARDLRPGSLVCEIGCNDGTLLKALRREGVRAYGVDPSSVAESIEGETIIRRYFNIRQAEELLSEFGRAQCVVMTNVLAHCPQPAELIRGAWELLEDGGLLVIEVPYLRDMIRNLEWGGIYHEHGAYFGMKAISRLLLGKYWQVEVTHLPKIHGGSLRITARRTPYTHLGLGGRRDDEGEGPWWMSLLADERAPIDWPGFRARIDAAGEALRQAIDGKADVIGLYAPAKATVMLNHWGIRLNRIIDDTPEKRGKFVPGVGTPIVSREEVGDPDLAVLLATNFREEAAAKETALAGKILCPLPELSFL